MGGRWDGDTGMACGGREEQRRKKKGKAGWRGRVGAGFLEEKLAGEREFELDF